MEEQEQQHDLEWSDNDFGDFGGINTDFDYEGFGTFEATFEDDENRYTIPSLPRRSEKTFVLYDNALRLAREIKMSQGMRSDVFVSGNFIFGDYIEAFMTVNNCHTDEMTISTLSMSQDNVDSLRTLMEKGYIDNLNLILSAYFYANERNSLIPYIYQELDFDDRLQLAICGSHTKTVHFKTMGGKYICIHGSANLRSSANIEQFTIEDNKELFDFYDERFRNILEKYATIRKPLRRKIAWDTFIKKHFKD